MTTTRVSPTTQEILHRQKADAATRRQAATPQTPTSLKTNNNTSLALTRNSAVATPDSTPAVAALAPDTRTELERHFDEVAPDMQFVGRRIQFDHLTGEYATADDGEPIANNSEYIALCNEVVGGWIRFNGPGELPVLEADRLYDGSNYVPPPRSALSDPEMAGREDDPWKRNYMLPLQCVKTRDLFTFSTSAKTQNPAIINLLREFDRKRRADPDKLPVVRLKANGYQSKNYGYQYKPVLVRVAWANRDDAAKPDTSTAADMNDELPW